MLTVNYARLERIVETQKPYRGNVNRFPIGNRKHITKCFYRREENGQTVFDIAYGYKYEREMLTLDEYVALSLAGADNIVKVAKWDSTTHRESTTEFDYYTFRNPPNVLGVVRPDNTFEFTAERYHQGERQFLSSLCSGWFTNDSRRGGIIYKSNYEGKRMLPIWKGMRVDCKTMEPPYDYKVFVKNVDRKMSKKLMSPYKDFFTTSEVMLKAMDWDTFIRVAGDVHTQYKPETGHDYDGNAYNSYGSIAERVKDTAPIDAAILFMLQMDVGNLRWDTTSYLRNGNVRTSRGGDSPEELFVNMKRGINKFIYRAHEETFKRVEYKAGERYPTGDWGVEVVVDGKQVEQCGYGI